jgi:hypothetical protein
VRRDKFVHVLRRQAMERAGIELDLGEIQM